MWGLYPTGLQPEAAPWLRRARLIILLGAAIPALAMASADVAPTGLPQTAAASPVETLVKLMNGEAGKLPDTVSVEDYEAALLFVISQSSDQLNIVISALDALEGTNAGMAKLMAAAENVRSSLLLRRVARGTAAISGDGESVIGTGFAAPMVTIGGGSSDYTT